MPIVKRYGMQRDNQRNKLYKAEKVLSKISKPLATVPDMEKFIKALSKKATIKKRYGNELNRDVYVGSGKARRAAGGDAKGVYMPLWSRTEYIVLHELAHCISMRKFGRNMIAPHGWEFCLVYMDLVRFVMGREAADLLKASFRQHKVRYKAKAKRTLSDDQRAALVARMARARAARTTKLAA